MLWVCPWGPQFSRGKGSLTAPSRPQRRLTVARGSQCVQEGRGRGGLAGALTPEDPRGDIPGGLNLWGHC